VHLECHAVLGWIIGNAGANERQIRNYTVIGAVLPDIDAIPYVISPFYYGLYHHTFGHNIFLWLLWSVFGGTRFRSWKAGLLGFVAFGSHLLTDAFLSTVEKKTKNARYFDYDLQLLFESARVLPKSDLPKLEALAPKMDEKFVDKYLEALEPLRPARQVESV